ncbi:MAG: purine-nucleoside phosphorylase [Verrucomicrobiia bacterium Tous-C3TDCM]|nr:MAG: purine-nucleoside phosphorylase [Verrucomicrobiae bacterium Tous-C3TDCM]PAZ06380.1 MAG: purine-nucleoside phosphorylase [Verrucomicrobiae bacterium AMD-G2]
MKVDTAIVLGSGLGSLANEVCVEKSIGFAEAGLPVSHVAGHVGRFFLGQFASIPLWVMQGRVHLYEGHSAQAATAGVRWLAEQGVTRIILTNAAGTLHPEYLPGRWMMLSDHLNLTGTSPLEGGPNFFDMSEVYSAEWRDLMRKKANELGMPLHEGVYAGLRGPQYETPAEIRMLRAIGADAVGMSTVLEAIQAKALGMEVLGFSCLTNWAAGMSSDELNHREVLETGKLAAVQMLSLLAAALPQDG